MTDVSGRTIGFFRESFQRLDLDPRTKLAAFGIDIEAPPAVFSWSTFAALCAELERSILAVGGNPEEFAKGILRANSLARMMRVLGFVISPDKLYEASVMWSGPATIPAIPHRLERLGDGRLQITITIPPYFCDCPAFLKLCAGLYRVLPSLLGYAEASVTWTLSPRRGVYMVTPPPAIGVLAHLHFASRLFRSAQSTLEELAEQQARLRQQNEALIRANAEAEILRRNAERAQEAALYALDLRRAFLMTVSHELRTPMNGIVAASELIATSATDERHVELGREIRASADRMVCMLDELLDFSRIEMQQMKLEPSPFDLRKELEAIVAHHMPHAHLRRNTVVVDVDPEIATWIVCDKKRLCQVIDHLFSNAVNFTEDGVITLSVRSENSETPDGIVLHVSVKDTGIGVNPDELGEIFEPFVQVERSTKRRVGGLGVGLAICRHVIELMGGKIHVESTHGEGSTFFLTVPVTVTKPPSIETLILRTLRPIRATNLPVPVTNEPAPSQRPPSVAHLTPPRVRVLIADDNSTNRLVARRIVERVGCDVDTVENGVDAVNAVRDETYDLVLMDCLMPIMDGLEATRAIRAMERGTDRHVPIVAVTANAQQSARTACMQAGMDEFLPKPLRPAILESVIKRFCPVVVISSHAPPPEPSA